MSSDVTAATSDYADGAGDGDGVASNTVSVDIYDNCVATIGIAVATADDL